MTRYDDDAITRVQLCDNESKYKCQNMHLAGFDS